MPPADHEPPFAPRRDHSLTFHGDTRVDPFHWLRDRDDPEVVALLEAENAYTKRLLVHTEDRQEALFKEMVARIQETDESVPARKGPYWYYGRTVEGLQYGIFCRREVEDGQEQVLLDENVLAEGHDFFALGAQTVSPDHRLLAYSTDFDGGERYTLRVRDLTTGQDLPDVIEGTYYGLAWAADNQTLFYVTVDDAIRPHRVWRHRLGTDNAHDVLVMQEDDERFHLGVHLSKSERYVVVSLESKVTTEQHVIDATQPDGPPRVIEPRSQGVEYGIEHHFSEEGDDRFFIVTNLDGAENFKLMTAPVGSPGASNWTEVIGHRDDVKLDGLDVFARHLVLFERTGGLRQIRVVRLADGESHVIEQPEPVYTVGGDLNPEFDTDTVRFGYTSMVTPRSTFDYDMEARTRVLRKQQPVLGGYQAADYLTERVWAVAGDGVRVPISVVRRRDTPHDGSAPGLLYGYGSYEHSIEPAFSSFRLSLLDRGFVYAIAHVRGGGEMGRRWYEDGKLLHKRNTFTDFIACADHLVEAGWVARDRLAIRGGSAGGLLVGAVLNMRPDVAAAAVAEVPFVDALTTILDETLPLTVLEWEEWGNPVADPEVYEYMKSYAPFDNVAAAPYPAVLVTAGLNDPRVSYWEPVKWVQRLRERTTSGRPILLKTEMGAGHMGPSGRYDAWRDEAFLYAFVLDVLDVPDYAGADAGPSSS